MRKWLKRTHLQSVLVLAIGLLFVYSGLKTVFVPTPVVGDNISTSNSRVPIDLAIVNVDGIHSNIYLYDTIRNNLYIYDENGEGIINIETISPGSVNVVEVNETEEYVRLQYLREDIIITVNFYGEVMNFEEVERDYNEEELELSSSYGDYKLKNRLFFYTLFNGDERIIVKLSLLPLVITGIIVFFGSLFLSQKQLQKDISEGKEIKMYGRSIFNKKK
jgi:hypothetical protein